MHGDLRIISPTDDNSELSSEGRLEVCINSAWGTICDAAYGTRDAQVACKQLGYDDEGNVHILKDSSHVFMFKYLTSK